MSQEAYEKGKTFEKQVEELLIKNSIKYERQKRFKGLGKRWLVDFYLPNYQAILECKNVEGKNVGRYLEAECTKFLDIRNRFFQMTFIIVLPKPKCSMGSFVRFCTLYNIKLTTPNRLIEALQKESKEINVEFGAVTKIEDKMLKIITDKGEEGITKGELARRVGCHPCCVYRLCRLKSEIIKSKFSPKRYFIQAKYMESNEYKLIQDLKYHSLMYSDRYLAKRYGFTTSQVQTLRLHTLKIKKKPGWNSHKGMSHKDMSLLQFISQKL